MLKLTLEEAMQEIEELKNQYNNLICDNRDLEEKFQDRIDGCQMQIEDLEKLNHELTNELNLERDKNEEYWKHYFKNEISQLEFELKRSGDERILIWEENKRLKSLIDNLLWYNIKKLEL